MLAKMSKPEARDQFHYPGDCPPYHLHHKQPQLHLHQHQQVCQPPHPPHPHSHSAQDKAQHQATFLPSPARTPPRSPMLVRVPQLQEEKPLEMFQPPQPILKATGEYPALAAPYLPLLKPRIRPAAESPTLRRVRAVTDN